jgi:hypothetical protein
MWKVIELAILLAAVLAGIAVYVVVGYKVARDQGESRAAALFLSLTFGWIGLALREGLRGRSANTGGTLLTGDRGQPHFDAGAVDQALREVGPAPPPEPQPDPVVFENLRLD